MSNPKFRIQRSPTGKIRVVFSNGPDDEMGQDWKRRKTVQESSIKNRDGSEMFLKSEAYMDTGRWLEPHDLTEQEKAIAAYIILTYE